MRVPIVTSLRAALILAALSAPAGAMIFYNTGDPSFNTTAPTGSLSGSGWQWAGNWGGYIGTPIGPRHFLTAAHVGGSVGDAFVFGGVNYRTIAIFDDPLTDLRICEVDKTFSTWAPLYTSTDEAGRELVAMGTGVSRGGPVYVGNNLAGWYWGTTSGTMRWGENSVAAVVNDPPYGDLLYSVFYASSNSNQATLAYNDSSGPIFINTGSGWQLAGIALAADGPFSAAGDGDNPFYASLFDGRGLYDEDSGTNPPSWVPITGSSPVPLGFYATRVSSRVAWIESIVSSADGGDAPLLTGPEMAALALMMAVIGSVQIWRRETERRGA